MHVCSAVMPGAEAQATGDRTPGLPSQRLESAAAQVQETQCLGSSVNSQQCLQPELEHVMLYKVLMTF